MQGRLVCLVGDCSHAVYLPPPPTGLQDGQPLSLRHYYGTTLLLERIKRGSQRVDVRKLKPNKDLSGGWRPLRASLCAVRHLYPPPPPCSYLLACTLVVMAMPAAAPHGGHAPPITSALSPQTSPNRRVHLGL